MVSLNPKMIGFVGASKIAEKHMSILSDMYPETKFIVLSKYIKNAYSGMPNAIFTSEITPFLEMHPEWVIITSPASEHAKYLHKILKNVNAVLIEKPVANTFDNAKYIRDIVDQATCPVVMGYNLRFMKSFSVLKSALEDEILGKIFHLQVSVGQDLKSWRPERDIQDTVSAQRDKGGGVLRELSHEFDLLQYLFGYPTEFSMISGRQKYTDFDVEDTALVHLKFNSPSSILASLNMDFTRRDLVREMDIIGEKGTLKCNFANGKIILATENNIKELYYFENDIKTSYKRMWLAFDAGRYDLFSSVEDAVQTLHLIENIEANSIKCQ